MTLPAGAGTAEVLVDVLLDPDTGSETVTVIPVQQRRGLVTYRLDSMPQPGQYNLGLVALCGGVGLVSSVHVDEMLLCCGVFNC